MYSLGHFSYVFVSQAHPQVIVFMQQNLLFAGVSDATGVVPEERKPSLKTETINEFSHFCILQGDFFLLVDVVFDRQQVITHGLEGELVQDR